MERTDTFLEIYTYSLKIARVLIRWYNCPCIPMLSGRNPSILPPNIDLKKFSLLSSKSMFVIVG